MHVYHLKQNAIRIMKSLSESTRLVTMDSKTLRWYALYTRPRFEKKVNAELQRKSVECYLPLQTIVRQWSDRKKRVEEPLFRGYIFVHVSAEERINSLQVDGVVRMVGFGGKPSIIPDDQIERLRCFLEGGFRLEPHDYLLAGDSVEIVHGPLTGIRGKLVEKRNENRFVISIDAIRQSVAVEIDPGMLKKLSEK